MNWYLRRLHQAHEALLSRSLYPVVLSSALAMLLLTARIYRSRSDAYIGLAWNLGLAWVPFLCSLWAARLHQGQPRRWWRLLAPGALWLAFFPNAPYIVTDFWHLQERPWIPLWYDIGLLSAFALSGLFLGVFSLRTMQGLVGHHLGRLAGWLFAAAAMGLGGLGVYLGRFLRWNSWDLLLNPRGVLADVAVRLSNPQSYPGAFGVTFLFAAILFVCYLALAPREPAPNR